MLGIAPQAAGMGGDPGGGGTPPRNQKIGPTGHYEEAPGAPRAQRTQARPFARRTLGALNTAMQYEENQLRQRAGSPPPESRKSNKRARPF